MESKLPTSHRALRLATTVDEQGRIELAVPFAPGTQVVVLVLQEAQEDDFSDLLAASAGTLGFWDNDLDEKEPVVGLWTDRADIADSAAFVRAMRRGEWQRQPDPTKEA